MGRRILLLNQIKSQKHSGFSIDNFVRIPAGDNDGIHRLAEYIASSPLSLARMINVDPVWWFTCV